MNARRLRDALDVLTWLADGAAALPEERKKAVQMQLTLATAGLFLAEYLAHTAQAGLEPYDALLKTVRGDMTLAELKELLGTLAKFSVPLDRNSTG